MGFNSEFKGLSVVSKNLIWTATHELKRVDPVSRQIGHSYCDLLWFSFRCFVLLLCHCFCVVCCPLSFPSLSNFSLFNSLCPSRLSLFLFNSPHPLLLYWLPSSFWFRFHPLTRWYLLAFSEVSRKSIWMVHCSSLLFIPNHTKCRT